MYDRRAGKQCLGVCVCRHVLHNRSDHCRARDDSGMRDAADSELHVPEHFCKVGIDCPNWPASLSSCTPSSDFCSAPAAFLETCLLQHLVLSLLLVRGIAHQVSSQRLRSPLGCPGGVIISRLLMLHQGKRVLLLPAFLSVTSTVHSRDQSSAASLTVLAACRMPLRPFYITCTMMRWIPVYRHSMLWRCCMWRTTTGQAAWWPCVKLCWPKS